MVRSMMFARTQIVLVFGVLALAAALTGAIAALPASAAPTSAPATPIPLPSIGPASSPTALPYPAYGTPAPGVASTVTEPGVPQVVTLSQAIAIAFARSPILATARGDVQLAQAALHLQETGYYPNIAGAFSTTRDNGQSSAALNQNTGTGTGTTGTSGGRGAGFTSNSLSASLRQLIFDGGKIAMAIRSAKRSEVAQVDTYRRSLETVAFDVAQSYYNSLAANRTTAVDEAVVRQNEVELDLVRAQANAGTVARADIATAEFPVAQARVALVEAQGAEFSAQAAFANSMGLDANTNVLPADDTPIFTQKAIQTVPVLSYDQAIARAILMRPDYDASLQGVTAAQYSLSSARRGYFPSLSGSASAGTASTDATGGTFRNSNELALSVSIPLYDQGITQVEIAQAQADLDEAKAALVTEQQSVQLNVKQALVNYISAQSAVGQADAEYTEALVVTQSTQAQYRAGVTTLPLLLDAEVSLTTALADQVRTVYALRQAEQAFLYAEGENEQQPERTSYIPVASKLPSAIVAAAQKRHG
jgi:outer membrane protein